MTHELPTHDMPKKEFSSMSPDVLVIGGGPAGSTISALLAERGHDVVMLEKAHHPRFHIGESLLPMNMPLFDRLGLRKEVEAMGIPKYGAEFVSPWHEHTSHFFFAEAMDKSFPYAVQVRRSELDELLFRHAADKGARTFEGSRVTQVEMNAGDETSEQMNKRALVKVLADDNTEMVWRPRFVIDASGRDTVLSNKFGIKHRSQKHASASLFGHFTQAVRQPGRNAGNISLFWFDYGWFWFIPLADGTTSVGVVASPAYFKKRKTDPSTFLMETIALAPKLAARLQDAQMIEPATATGNYSYHSECCRGDRFILLGDAFTFVDPMFSSGVFLAMNSAFEGATAVDHWLRGEKASAEKAFRHFECISTQGPNMFSWFIYRITSPAIRNIFMYPRNTWRMKEAMLSLLAGDLFRNTPIGPKLIGFKFIYYIACLTTLPAVFKLWLQRRRNLRESLKDEAATAP